MPNTGTVVPSGHQAYQARDQFGRSFAGAGWRIVPRCRQLLQPRHLVTVHTMSDDASTQRPLGSGQPAVLFLGGGVLIAAVTISTYCSCIRSW